METIPPGAEPKLDAALSREKTGTERDSQFIVEHRGDGIHDRAPDAGRCLGFNRDASVGHQGSAVKAFAGRAGRVSIDGKEWAAELDDGEALEAGASIEVTGVEGSRLKVRRA